jgi:hypothetical protein
MVLLGLQKCYQTGKPVTPVTLRFVVLAQRVFVPFTTS